MEHYRIAMHLDSPSLKTVNDGPSGSNRHSASAKYTGSPVLIEREATRVPAPDVSNRVTSAPPGQCIKLMSEVTSQ